jgi:hypothetical protein
VRIGISIGIDAARRRGFAPASLTGLLAWYEVTAATITLNGSNVSGWADKSGNGVNASQGTGGNQPAYNASSANFNGRGSIACAASKWLTTGSLTMGPFTVVVVGLYSGSAGYMYTFNANNQYLFGTINNSVNVTRSAVSSGKNLSSNWSTGSATPRTIIQRFNGTHASHGLRINGVNQTLSDGVGTSDPGSSTATGTMFINASASGTSASTGELGEILVYNRSLSDAECLQIETWQRSRFNHY